MLSNKRICVIHEIMKNKHFGAKLFWQNYQAGKNLPFVGESVIHEVLEIIDHNTFSRNNQQKKKQPFIDLQWLTTYSLLIIITRIRTMTLLLKH